MPTPHEEALSNLLWRTLPMRNVFKGSHRDAFMADWIAAAEALSKGHFELDEEALQTPRTEAVRLFMHCLNACAALGVRPGELVPMFNDKADGGFSTDIKPLDALTLLGRHAARVARLHIEARKDAA